jgi:hypothetical protein
LKVKQSGFDSNYDMNLNGDTLNEFASIASIIAFSQLSTQRVKLTQQFNNPDYLYVKGGYEKLVK